MPSGYVIADCSAIELVDSTASATIVDKKLADALRSNKPIYISNISVSISGVVTRRSGWGDVTTTGAYDGKSVLLIQKDCRLTFSTDGNNVSVSYHALSM